MSFGFSVGDFVALGTLAFSIYQRCHDGPDEFQALSVELANLRNVVDLVGLNLADRELNAVQQMYLKQLRGGCQEMLEEVEAMLTKYESLGTNRKLKWKWIGWGKERAPGIRQRLALNIGMLTSFNTTLAASGVARIEKGLNQLRDDIQAGRHQGSVISSNSLDEAKEGDENVWRELTQALEDVGVSEAMINENREFIVTWLSRALKEGELEERPPAQAPPVPVEEPEVIWKTSDVDAALAQVMAQLTEEKALRTEAEEKNKTIGEQLEQLTAALFEEANKMVTEARKGREVVGQENERLRLSLNTLLLDGKRTDDSHTSEQENR